MKTKILLFTFLLLLSGIAQAQNTSEQDSGILSSLPDIEIDSVDNHNNSTGQASGGQSMLSWIIVLGLVFLGVLLYSFNIDPKWMIVLIGAAALVFFLTQSGLVSV